MPIIIVIIIIKSVHCWPPLLRDVDVRVVLCRCSAPVYLPGVLHEETVDQHGACTGCQR